MILHLLAIIMLNFAHTTIIIHDLSIVNEYIGKSTLMDIITCRYASINMNAMTCEIYKYKEKWYGQDYVLI